MSATLPGNRCQGQTADASPVDRNADPAGQADSTTGLFTRSGWF